MKQPAPFSSRRLALAMGLCLAALVGAFGLAVTFGEQSLRLEEVGVSGSSAQITFFSIRLPRVLLAGLVGCALASSGAMLQSLLRNPLADPFVLGVSGGAAVGATVAMALGISSVAWLPGLSGVTVFALLGAFGATVVVLGVGQLAGGNSPNSTLLAGVIFNAFALAAITFIKALVAPDKLGEIFFWLSGRLLSEEWSVLGGTAVVVGLSVAALVALSPRLNLLTLGEEDARSLGVDVKRTRWVLLMLASMVVAAVVALSGLVGFVGLLVPQLVRLSFGPDQRVAVPASALLGAAFLMLADLFARLLLRLFQVEPPVGAITALIGGPAFLALMARRRG